MPAHSQSARRTIERILSGATPAEVARSLRPRLPSEVPLAPNLPSSTDYSAAGLRARRELLEDQGIRLRHLAEGEADPEVMAGHTENFIGFTRVPVGVIGPLRVNGTAAKGDFYVPLATTEGALVASYHRGAYVISHCGGASVLCMTESVGRSPAFVFDSLAEACQFVAWVLPQTDALQRLVGETSRHCRLTEVKTSIIGKEVYLLFEFTTGDAAGQNMVTFAAEAICRRLVEGTPVAPRRWYLEANMSGDKKATVGSFAFARGKKVVAEVTVPRRLLRRFVHAEPAQLMDYWEVSVLGAIQSGAIGAQGHYANALAALFIACGQDAACVSEAAVGLTRMDLTDQGDLYVAVTLPNLIVGTVGGGTSFPTARECLEMIGCYGEGRARKLAEIAAATALAGEISIIGALAAGDFGKAHQTYARKAKRR
jgi:hydroxymethylglutaryl-CoA reductase (NADPH)